MQPFKIHHLAGAQQGPTWQSKAAQQSLSRAQDNRLRTAVWQGEDSTYSVGFATVQVNDVPSKAVRSYRNQMLPLSVCQTVKYQNKSRNLHDPLIAAAGETCGPPYSPNRVHSSLALRKSSRNSCTVSSGVELKTSQFKTINLLHWIIAFNTHMMRSIQKSSLVLVRGRYLAEWQNSFCFGEIFWLKEPIAGTNSRAGVVHCCFVST